MLNWNDERIDEKLNQKFLIPLEKLDDVYIRVKELEDEIAHLEYEDEDAGINSPFMVVNEKDEMENDDDLIKKKSSNVMLQPLATLRPSGSSSTKQSRVQEKPQ